MRSIYLRPLAVLKISTSSFGWIQLFSTRRRSAATQAAPSGQKKMPSAFPTRGISASISSSLTLSAVPWLSRIACNIKKSATACGHTQTGGDGCSILPRLRGRFIFVKGFNDRRAATRLNRYHARPRAADPAQFFHLVKSFPHADESRAAAGGVDDDIRQMPIELFGDLVAHGLFAFEPIGLFQSRDIEPAFG